MKLPLKLLDIGVPIPDSYEELLRQWLIYWAYDNGLVVGDKTYWLGAHYSAEEADLFSEAVINGLQETVGS